MTAALVITTPAQATVTSSPCDWNGMCYWYRSGYGGAQTAVYNDVFDLAYPAVYFYGPGDGSGKRLWNDAGSGANYNWDYCVGVYYSVGWGTPALYLDPYGYYLWYSWDLAPVNNDNRSQLFYWC